MNGGTALGATVPTAGISAGLPDAPAGRGGTWASPLDAAGTWAGPRGADGSWAGPGAAPWAGTCAGAPGGVTRTPGGGMTGARVEVGRGPGVGGRTRGVGVNVGGSGW